MDTIVFLVQGSSPDPYVVSFAWSGTNLTAKCTCPAGRVGQHCKHRLAILRGLADGIVSPNHADVGRVRDCLPGTDVERAIFELAEAESQFEQAKRKLAGVKKKVVRVMSG